MKYESDRALEGRNVLNYELQKKWSLPVATSFKIEINLNNIYINSGPAS
jgi:hypothetical protein